MSKSVKMFNNYGVYDLNRFQSHCSGELSNYHRDKYIVRKQYNTFLNINLPY